MKIFLSAGEPMWYYTTHVPGGNESPSKTQLKIVKTYIDYIKTHNFPVIDKDNYWVAIDVNESKFGNFLIELYKLFKCNILLDFNFKYKKIKFDCAITLTESEI